MTNEIFTGQHTRQKKAKSFMEEFPTYTYVVVGDEMPCNIYIPWDKRSELLEVLNDE